MADILAQLQDIVAFAQANQTAEANKIQQLHNFQSDDCVLINTRNMPLSYSAAAPASDTDADSLGYCLVKLYSNVMSAHTI